MDALQVILLTLAFGAVLSMSSTFTFNKTKHDAFSFALIWLLVLAYCFYLGVRWAVEGK